ncbi:hypothetical protein R1sor_015944 [Riccia sorocarpa]|uniref:Transmembrane protein n=1 Tax=Riccia sorocarpa TaxID=122646 RepID=A0ABD3HH21_9MARC
MQELKQTDKAPTTSGGSEVSNVSKSTSATAAASSKPPPSRIQYYLNSGSKRHVFVGLLLVSAISCAPWFLLTSGSKHQNHADYMDQAEKARQSRLSSSAAQAAADAA